MTSSRPYLLRAMYEWILDNQWTPYVMVNADSSNVLVPRSHVKHGEIVLNIEPQAVGAFRMGNDALEFDARFSGIAHHIYVPIRAVKSIYAFENMRGMVFGEEQDDDPPPTTPPSTESPKSDGKKARPELKIIK